MHSTLHSAEPNRGLGNPRAQAQARRRRRAGAVIYITLQYVLTVQSSLCTTEKPGTGKR